MPAKKSKRIQKKRKQGFSWKLAVKNKKTKKKLQRLLAGAFMFFLSLSMIVGISLQKALNKPFASAESGSSFDLKNAEIASLAVISVENLKANPIKTKAIDVLFFDKARKKVVSFEIPLELETDLPGKFGKEQYSKVFTIGTLDTGNLEDGGKMMTRALKKDFATNIDRYLVADEKTTQPIVEVFKTGKVAGVLNYENLLSLTFNSTSNASASDLYSFYTFVTGLPSDRFINHNESVSHFQLENFLDTLIRDMTFESMVSEERASVAVLNGTDIPGTASFGARVMENMGAHVITRENASKQYKKSKIVTSDMNLAVVGELQRYFSEYDIEIEVKRPFSNDEAVSDRVDVTFIAGFDIAENL